MTVMVGTKQGGAVQMMNKYTNMTVAMMLTVSGSDSLLADSQIRVTPGLSGETGMDTSGDTIVYTVTK